jgi:hypothetical protein
MVTYTTDTAAKTATRKADHRLRGRKRPAKRRMSGNHCKTETFYHNGA